VAIERLAGLDAELSPRQITYKLLNGTWTEGSGEKAVASWLRLKTTDTFRPGAVLCQNDSMAVGARRAILAARPDWADVPFFGCDGLPEGGQRLVRDGQIAGTVIIRSNTGPALELLSAFYRQAATPPRELLLAPTAYPPESELARKPRSER
jgi:ABC-type sugar transport system substrate-binding protein